MARISGLEKKEAPWHLRWFYCVMQKMFGKDFAPAKIQMRLPGLVWGGIAMEAAIGRKRLVSLRYIRLGKIRAVARIGYPSRRSFLRLAARTERKASRTADY